MANDRLYLMCKKCKAGLFIYKYYPFGGGWGGYAMDDLTPKVDAFFQEHIVECQEFFGFDFGNDPPFVLVTEQQYADAAPREHP
jgi:hypothetical protein